jgi:hypothetical protein
MRQTQIYPLVGVTTANVHLMHGALLGAGAAAPTKPSLGGITNGRAGRGIRSVARTAAGRYTLTLSDAGAAVVGFFGTVHTAATVAPMLIKYVEGSLVQATAPNTFPTIAIEVWDLATPALADAPLNALMNIDVLFIGSPQP